MDVPHELPDMPIEFSASTRLTNMDLCLRTMLAAQGAGEGAPRLAIFYGWSGLGKTVAAAHAAAVTGAVYILATRVMTQKSFLETLARELGLARPGRTSSDMLNNVIQRLNQNPQPLVIDEMDYLAKDQLVGIIRDIHDACNIPILMIGEEGLPALLKQWERFDNRIIAATPAQRASIADGRILRDIYARRVHVADDLVDHFTTRCKGITRRIVVNIQDAQSVALEEFEASKIVLAMWGDRQVRDGSLPRRQA